MPDIPFDRGPADLQASTSSSKKRPFDPSSSDSDPSSKLSRLSSAPHVYPFWNSTALQLSFALWKFRGSRDHPFSPHGTMGSFDRLARSSWFKVPCFRAEECALPGPSSRILLTPPDLWPRVSARLKLIDDAQERAKKKKEEQTARKNARPLTPKQLQQKAEVEAKKQKIQAEKDLKAVLKEAEKERKRVERELKACGKRKRAPVNSIKKEARCLLQLESKRRKLAEKEALKAFKKEHPASRSRLVRLRVDRQQCSTLMKWFGAYRWTYNQCVNALRNDESVLLSDLRNKYVNLSSPFLKDFPWVKDTPYNLRDEAVQEFRSSLASSRTKSNQAREKGEKVVNCDPKTFRRRKADHESFSLPCRYYQSGCLFGSYWRSWTDWTTTLPNGETLTLRKNVTPLNPLITAPEPRNRMPKEVIYGCRLVRRGPRFYFHLGLSRPSHHGIPDRRRQSRHRKQWCENKAPISSVENPLLPPPSEKIVAIDPGIRTFATLYDAAGCVLHWGAGDFHRLQRLCHHIDDITSDLECDPDMRARTRGHLRCLVLPRMRARLRNIVAELHHKLALYLCENYNVILLPKFETSKMVKRASRRLGRKSVRNLLTWSHGRFRERLLQKAEEYPWVRVILVREDYTSKTCGRCGVIGKPSREKLKCKVCHYEVDRDLNGARNILLRWLTCDADHKELEEVK